MDGKDDITTLEDFRFNDEVVKKKTILLLIFMFSFIHSL